MGRLGVSRSKRGHCLRSRPQQASDARSFCRPTPNRGDVATSLLHATRPLVLERLRDRTYIPACGSQTVDYPPYTTISLAFFVLYLVILPSSLASVRWTSLKVKVVFLENLKPSRCGLLCSIAR